MAVDPARVKSLFLAAAELADPAERAAFLDRECGGDHALRQRVEALLRADAAVAALPPDASSVPPHALLAPTADHLPTTEPQPGTMIAGKYKLSERIGEGGMGTVWVAHQAEPVKRKVALKLIKPGMDSRSVLARFEAERQALALMDHPNIARVLDGGLHDGRPFFVMELVKGVPITEFCDARKLTPSQRLELFVPVCQAIQHAHQKGIIHRDIKPSNVLVALYDDRPVPKVIDFGVAKATGGTLTEQTLETAFGGVVGTPQYMSPEQASLNNLDIDTRSDVYSLGVLLYELLAGSPPFARQELRQAALLEILRVVREEEPPRPSLKLSSAEALPSLSANRSTEPRKLTNLLRNELDWIVMKALEKDRARRYETANGFAADVNRYLAGEPVLAHPPSAAYRLRKFVRRHRPQVVAASLVLLALVAGVVGTTLGLVQANQAVEAERLARDDAIEQQRLAEQAAAQERQAKVREAQRADGEKKAKLDAEAKRQQAEHNLAFARKANAILGSVFAGLDPKKIAESGRPLQDVLRQNLSKAVEDLEGSAIGEPLEVAAMQNTLGVSLLGLGEAGLAVEVFGKALDTRKALLGPDHPSTLSSMNNLAVAYQEGGQLARALPLLEETLKKRKATLGPDHLDTLSTMNNLAEAYSEAGQLDLAVPLFEATLQKKQATLGADHPDTFTSMNNLASAYQDGGQLDRALELFEATLEKTKAALGPDHPHTLLTMSNLAGAYRATGQLDRAVPLFEEALQKMKAALGPDHPHTLATMRNLAVAYGGAGKFDLAQALLEEALPKQKAKLGLNHPSTLLTMSNLAVAYWDSGQLARALPLFEETLQKQKVRLGPDHPHTLTTTSNLARAYQDSGQLARALPLFEETFEKQKAKLGADHPDTLTTMNNLAAAYQAGGQLARALPLFEETFEKRKARLGPNHFLTLNSMNNLAGAYQAAGQVKRALPLFKETLEKRKAQLGPDHPDTLAGMHNLAEAYRAAGQINLAVPLFEETLQKRKARLGPEHPDTLQSMNNLACAYLDGGQLARAVPLFEETLQKRKVKLGPDHADTLISMSNLAEAYRAGGQLAKALPLLEEVLEKRKATLGPDHPSTLTSMNNLAEDYRTTRQLAKAVPLFEEALEKRKARLGPDHRDTLLTMNNLALAYMEGGQLARAVPLFEETLQKRKVKLGPNHADTVTSMNNLAVAYRNSGQLDRALPLFEEALAKRKASLGPDHFDTLVTMGNLGKAYVEARQGAKAAATLGAFVDGIRKRTPKDSTQFAGVLAQVALELLGCGQHAAAEPLLRECLAIREKQLPDQWVTFNTQSLLGGALLGQKKYADAEPLLLKGYEGMKTREKTIPKGGGSRLPEAVDRLIELYTATNRPDELKTWQAERAKYPKAAPTSPEKK
jgi:serine/threonine protein kinase/lipopolysaccharide biosynthesis regulator YciM